MLKKRRSIKRVGLVGLRYVFRTMITIAAGVAFLRESRSKLACLTFVTVAFSLSTTSASFKCRRTLNFGLKVIQLKFFGGQFNDAHQHRHTLSTYRPVSSFCNIQTQFL